MSARDDIAAHEPGPARARRSPWTRWLVAAGGGAVVMLIVGHVYAASGAH